MESYLCPVCGDDVAVTAGEPFPPAVLQCLACGAHYEPCLTPEDWEEGPEIDPEQWHRRCAAFDAPDYDPLDHDYSMDCGDDSDAEPPQF